MLIDGELVEAASGKTLRQHQPGHRRGARARSPTRRRDDMQRAIAAARRAFDETDWSTNHAFRKQLPRSSCRRRSRASRRSCAPSSSPRSAARSSLTYGPQLDAPLERRPALAGASSSTTFEWERELPDGTRSAGNAARKVVQGGRRRRRRDRAVELPVRGVAPEDRPGAGHRQHGDPQARARHAVERHPHRSPRRRADRHPAGRVQRGHVVRPPRRRGARRSSPLVDLISFTGSTATGKRIFEKGGADDEAPVPRARRQVGRHRARRRRPRGEDGAWRRMVVRARRPGLRDAHPHARARVRATTRRIEIATPGLRRTSPTATPPTRATSRARRSAPSSATACSATSRRARRKAPASSSVAVVRRSSTRAASCEPTLFADVDQRR